jgi:hypothetical protein
MALETFRYWKPKQDTLMLVAHCVNIIEELSAYKLTLRQLYYQLVSRNIIPNVERSYKNLSRVVTRARLAGLLDWSAIEDRVRQPDLPLEYDNLQDLVYWSLQSYRLPRWKGQEYYAELWVEKDALASVLRPLAQKYHVVLMVNRGYSSASAMYDSAKRFLHHRDQDCTLFYLGDLDPSGEDMVRDIRERLLELDAPVRVEKIALTMDQVQEYDPPPNPAKMTDPRAADFISKYGTESWEVDALPPAVLEQLISEKIESVLDLELYAEVINQEEKDKMKLRDYVEGLEE